MSSVIEKGMSTFLTKDTCTKLQFTIVKNLTPCKNFSIEDGMFQLPESLKSSKVKQNDYALLKLLKPSILHEVTIMHSTLKSFAIYAGLSEDKLNLICEGKMRHDDDGYVHSSTVQNKINFILMPCLYVKFCPYQYHHSSRLFDVEDCLTLYGSADEMLVTAGISNNVHYENTLSVKLCLKYLRQRGYMEAFDSLSRSSNVSLEHGIVRDLYKCIIDEGDFEKCEKVVEQYVEDGCCDEFINAQKCRAKWTLLGPLLPQHPTLPTTTATTTTSTSTFTTTSTNNTAKGDWDSNNNEKCWPKNRGGHQICVNSVDGALYMFGGWDGHKDLADLWMFDIKCQSWKCLSQNVTNEGGPTARSCHKMCIDLQTKKIYMIGKYLENDKRASENLFSDFYCYDITCNTWELLSSDTSSQGGPSLVFDHQMAIDDENKFIYIFGGNNFISLSACEDRSVHPIFMSIFVYNISKRQWRQIEKFNNVPLLRTGHSLLFSSKLKCLFLFGGHHQRYPTNDFHVFKTTEDGDLEYLRHLTTKNFLPESLCGFTHRSTIDSDRDEIYIISGVNKDATHQERSREFKQNSLWLYNIKNGLWDCVYNDESIQKEMQQQQHNSSSSLSYLSSCFPVPRFAHQFVYDVVQKVHYLFGGNPNQDIINDVRLNDLWMMRLTHVDRVKVKKELQLLVREHRYIEMTYHDKTSALNYLQNELRQLVDLTDREQLEKFESLPSILFKTMEYSLDNSDAAKNIEKNRMELLKKISGYLPESYREPSLDLMDLIPARPFDPINAFHL